MSEPVDWKTLYAAAMLEADRTLAGKRVEKADQAIRRLAKHRRSASQRIVN